jgi:hypothetical protein
MNHKISLTVLCLALVACGGNSTPDPKQISSGNAGACYFQDPPPETTARCTNFVGTSYAAAEVKATCSGTYYADGCPSGSKGVCHMKKGEPGDAYLHSYYGDDNFTAGLKANCEANDGIWGEREAK